MLPKNRPPTHPGEVLLEEFLVPQKMTQAAVAAKLGLPIQRINTIINKKRGITPETAILLARLFQTSPEFWMNLQTKYDLWQAARRMTASRPAALQRHPMVPGCVSKESR